MAVSDDIQELQKAGYSPEQILESIQQTNPVVAPDITSLQKTGYNSAQILESVTHADSEGAYNSKSSSPSASILVGVENLGKAAMYGLGNAIGGAGATESALGADGVGNAALSAGNKISSAANYNPSDSNVSVTDPHTWGNFGNYLAQSAPDLAGTWAAAKAGSMVGGAAFPEGGEIAGGLIGGGAYWLNRLLGTKAYAIAQANGRQTPNASDVTQALPAATAEAALNSYGAGKIFNPSKITGAGLQALKQSAGNVVKAGLGNALASGGSSAIDQASSGQPIDLSQVGNAAALGGITGAGLRTVGEVPQAFISSRLSGVDPRAASMVAQDMNSGRISGDPSNPSDAARMMQSASSLYTKDANSAISDTRSAANQLDKIGADSSHLNGAADRAQDYLTNLKAGPLDPGQTTDIDNSIRQANPQLADSLLKLHALSQLKDQMNSQDSADAAAKPGFWNNYRLLHYASEVAKPGGLILAFQHHNPVWAGVSAAPYALGAVRALGKIATGSRNPLGTFVDRFGNSPAPAALVQNAVENPPPRTVDATPQAAPDEQAAPLQGQLMPPEKPAGLLPPPPIRGGSSPFTYGEGFTMGPNSNVEPNGPPAPAAPLALPPPRRLLPAPDTIYGPQNATAWDYPFPRPSAFTMQRQQQSGPTANPTPPEPPRPAPERPPATPAPAPVARTSQAAAAAPKPAPAPIQTPPSFEAQAAAIQAEVNRAQQVLADPNADAQTKVLARQALIKAATEAGNLHDQATGNAKSQRPRAAKAAEAPKQETVSPEVVHIKGSHLTRVQAKSHIRKGAGNIRAGMDAKHGARISIAKAAEALPLSKEAKAKLPAASDQLISRSAVVNNRAAGKQALNEFLGNFSGKDRDTLANHFENAKGANGGRFLDQWDYAGPQEVEHARDYNAKMAAIRAKRAANREAKKKT